MAENKQYGLILSNKAGARSKPLISKTSIFGNDDEEDKVEDTRGRPTPKYDVQTDTKKAFLKRQVQADLEKALAEDPNVFEYDSIYDEVQEKKSEHIKRTQEIDADRKPKYIGGLMKAAELRKKEHERRLEKTVQKEREQEKGMYDNKEAFVTGAYKKKMEERKLEEEMERRKQLLEERMDVTKQEDMSLFYRNILNQTTGSAAGASTAVIKEEPIVASTSSAAGRVPNPDTQYPEDRDDSSSDNSDSSDSESSNRFSGRKTKQKQSKRGENTEHDTERNESRKGVQSKWNDEDEGRRANSSEIHAKRRDVRDQTSSETEMRTTDGKKKDTENLREDCSSSKGEKSNSSREKGSKHSEEKERDSDRDKKRGKDRERETQRDSQRGEKSDGSDRGRETRKHSSRDERRNGGNERYADVEDSRHRRKNDECESRKDSRTGEKERTSRDEASWRQRDRKDDVKRKNSSSDRQSSDDRSLHDASSRSDSKNGAKLDSSQTKAQPSTSVPEQSVTKFAKKTVDSALNDARAKYLARKAAAAPAIAEDSD